MSRSLAQREAMTWETTEKGVQNEDRKFSSRFWVWGAGKGAALVNFPISVIPGLSGGVEEHGATVREIGTVEDFAVQYVKCDDSVRI